VDNPAVDQALADREDQVAVASQVVKADPVALAVPEAVVSLADRVVSAVAG